MKKLLFAILILLSIGACKKGKVKEVNTNNSRDSLTYQPKVPDSKWTYNLFLSGFFLKSYNVTSLNYDSVLNGKTYHVFDDENLGRQYVRQDGDKYYTVLTAAANKTELLSIDASKNVGESWVGGVNGSDTYTYTMMEKYPIYYLDGFTFKNVLKIYQERSNGNTTDLKGDTYYAQGIGQIKSTGTLNNLPVDVKLITVDLK